MTTLTQNEQMDPKVHSVNYNELRKQALFDWMQSKNFPKEYKPFVKGTLNTVYKGVHIRTHR